jgi:hypothetical protein
MLINWENKELNISEFKKAIKSLRWEKHERKLGISVETWYIGLYEDDKKIIQVSIRPTKRMQVSETFKLRKPNGTAPSEKELNNPTARNKLVDYGCTAQVKVDDSFVQMIKNIAVKPKKKQIQELSW